MPNISGSLLFTGIPTICISMWRLTKYIREQVEEEANATNLIERVRMAKDAAILFLDKELAARQ